jgi:hypothetical protein
MMLDELISDGVYEGGRIGLSRSTLVCVMIRMGGLALGLAYLADVSPCGLVYLEATKSRAILILHVAYRQIVVT